METEVIYSACSKECAGMDMIAGSRIFTWEIAWIIRVWICCLWVEDLIGNRV
jgi:hypothetical protein